MESMRMTRPAIRTFRLSNYDECDACVFGYACVYGCVGHLEREAEAEEEAAEEEADLEDPNEK